MNKLILLPFLLAACHGGTTDSPSDSPTSASTSAALGSGSASHADGDGIPLSAAATSQGRRTAADSVRVVNTAGEAVPTVAVGTTAVSGTVQIGNTPAVSLAPGASVTVASLPAVGLDPANNTVRVASSATAPVLIRDVDGALNQPFNFNLVPALLDGVATTSSGFIVPAGKRLVIEYVVADVSLPSGQTPRLSLSVAANGAGSVTYPLLVTAQPGAFAGSIPDRFMSSQQVRIYADQGTVVTVNYARNGVTGVAPSLWAISGHFVNL